MTLGNGRSINDRTVFARPTKPPVEKDGIMWVDTSVEQRTVRTYSEATGAWERVTPTGGVSSFVEAATWAETEISALTHDRTVVSNESLEMTDSVLDRASGPSLDDKFNSNSKWGLKFTLTTPANSLSFKAYYDSDVTIEDASDGTVMWNGTVTGGADVTANVELSAGDYRIYKDGSASSTDSHQQATNYSYPYAGEEIEITGYYTDSNGSGYFNFHYLESDRPAVAANATVEFVHPNAIKEWTSAVFDRDQAGEAAEIDAKLWDESTASWETVGTNIGDGFDLSNYDPRELAFDFRFSRDDTANNPVVRYLTTGYNK